MFTNKRSQMWKQLFVFLIVSALSLSSHKSLEWRSPSPLLSAADLKSSVLRNPVTIASGQFEAFLISPVKLGKAPSPPDSRLSSGGIISLNLPTGGSESEWHLLQFRTWAECPKQEWPPFPFWCFHTVVDILV